MCALRNRRSIPVPVDRPVLVHDGTAANLDVTTRKLAAAFYSHSRVFPLLLPVQSLLDGSTRVISRLTSRRGPDAGTGQVRHSWLKLPNGEIVHPTPLFLADIPIELRVEAGPLIKMLRQAGFSLMGVTSDAHWKISNKDETLATAKALGLPLLRQANVLPGDTIDTAMERYETIATGGVLAWARPVIGTDGGGVRCVTSQKELADLVRWVHETNTPVQLNEDALNISVLHPKNRNEQERLVRLDASVMYLRGVHEHHLQFGRVQAKPFLPCNTKAGAQIIDDVRDVDFPEGLLEPTRRFFEAVGAPYGRGDYLRSTLSPHDPETFALLRAVDETDPRDLRGHQGLVDRFRELQVDGPAFVCEFNAHPGLRPLGTQRFALDVAKEAIASEKYLTLP